jgi:hypothetical protein
VAISSGRITRKGTAALPGWTERRGDSLGARILAVADSLDALISERPYHGAIPIEEAITALAAEAGDKLDPKVVKAFEDRIPGTRGAAHCPSVRPGASDQ